MIPELHSWLLSCGRAAAHSSGSCWVHTISCFWIWWGATVCCYASDEWLLLGYAPAEVEAGHGPFSPLLLPNEVAQDSAA